MSCAQALARVSVTKCSCLLPGHPDYVWRPSSLFAAAAVLLSSCLFHPWQQCCVSLPGLCLGSPMPCFLVLRSLWNLSSQVSCMSLLWVFPRSMSCTLVGCLALHLHRWLMSVIAQISSPVYAQCIGLFVCQLPIVRLLSPVSSCTTGHRLPRALWARIMHVRFCL